MRAGGEVDDLSLMGCLKEGFPGQKGVKWQQDLRLNESARGRVRMGAELKEVSGKDGLDLVRLQGCAQENKNKPPLLDCLDCGVVKSGMRTGIVHVFIILGPIAQTLGRVYGRYALWEGTSGQSAIGMRIITEVGRARRRWKV
jgi:hypothetical protein